MKSDSRPERKFWQVALADLERELGTDAKGLTTSEAALRRLRYGPNALEERRRLSLPLKFLSRFRWKPPITVFSVKLRGYLLAPLIG